MSAEAFETVRNAENEAQKSISEAKEYLQQKKDEAAEHAKMLENRFQNEISEYMESLEREEKAKKSGIIAIGESAFASKKEELDSFFEKNKDKYMDFIIKKGVSGIGDSKD